MSEKETKNEPLKKIRMGNVTATVWVNPTKKGKMFSVDITKSYKTEEKDDKGNDVWKTTSSYSRNDLPKVQAISALAYEWLFSEEALKALE